MAGTSAFYGRSLGLLTFTLSGSSDSCCAAARPLPAPLLPRDFRTESCVSDKQLMACRGQARGCAGGGRTVVFHRHHWLGERQASDPTMHSGGGGTPHLHRRERRPYGKGNCSVAVRDMS